MGNITSFSSPHRGLTTNDSSDEPEQQPTTNYASVAEASAAYAAAEEEAKVKAEQQTSNSSPRRVKKEHSVPLPSLNGLTAGRRKRTQTDFLSPTFTPQKRVKKEDGTATATAVKTETTGEEETTPSRDGKVYAKYDKAWNNNYQLLANYKDEFGDCKVPPSYKVEDSDDEVTTIGKLYCFLFISCVLHLTSANNGL